MTGAADSRTGGRKKKNEDSSEGASGARRSRGAAFACDPHKIAPRANAIHRARIGGAFGRAVLSCDFWEAQSSAHARRVLWNSSSAQFGKSAAPPTTSSCRRSISDSYLICSFSDCKVGNQPTRASSTSLHNSTSSAW